LGSAAHVLVVWALLEFNWAVFADWASFSLEPLLGSGAITRPDNTFCVVSIRDHVVTAFDAVSTIFGVPNVIGWHWVALSNASRAVIVDKGVGWAVNDQLSVSIENFVQSRVTGIFFALSWEANFTCSSITVVKNRSWILSSRAYSTETVLINDFEISW